jgi:endonuclease YncB( thermonuclease family)
VKGKQKEKDYWDKLAAEPGYDDFRLHPAEYPTKDWRGFVVAVTDGDTVEVKIDRGDMDLSLWRVRLVGRGGRWFDAPEMRGKDGKTGRLWQEELAALVLSQPVLVHTEKVSASGVAAKTFERYVAWLTRPDDGRDIVDLLVRTMEEKHGLHPKRYDPERG